MSTFRERVNELLVRNCDSTTPSEWCVQTGACECQLMLDLLDAVGGRETCDAGAVASTAQEAPPTAFSIDRDIEKILAMTDAECLQAGIAEYGSEEAWRQAMGALRSKMLKVVDAALASPSTEGWRGMESAPKEDETEIWVYTTEGYQRVVHWEEAQPSAPDDPGHDAGWMSEDGATHPSCFYYRQQPAVDPPLRWRLLPDAPDLEQEYHADELPEPKASTS